MQLDSLNNDELVIERNEGTPWEPFNYKYDVIKWPNTWQARINIKLRLRFDLCPTPESIKLAVNRWIDEHVK